MRFSQVVTGLRDGLAFTRVAWEAGSRIFLVPASDIRVDAERPLGKAYPALVGSMVVYRQHIDIVTAEGEVSVWTVAQADVLADDWLGVGK